ncbi:flippase-like domain-containing protein [Candidatus Bathyarchaeota archaeon]|nr:flippase-like domain-containing protein [Candidatus Bathyarchaeota archaeon]
MNQHLTANTLPQISPSLKKWIILTSLIGYMALALYLFHFVGLDDLFSVVGKVNIGIYALAIASVAISLFFHTLVWFQLLNSVGIRLSLRRTHVLYWVGVFVDNLIPGGWSGDLFKAYLLNKDPSVESGKAVASVVAKNMYEAIFNLGNMVLGVILLLLNYTFEGTLLITLGGIMMLLTLPLIILLTASFKPESAKKIVASLFRFLSRIGKNRWHLSELEAKVENALGDYYDGMAILLKNPRVLFKPMLLSFLAWGFEVITLLLVFASLGQLVGLDKVIIVRSIAGNVEAQGYAFLGYAQIITSELYRSLGVSFAIGASVALLGGIVIFWIKTAISYAAFHYTVFSRKPTLPLVWKTKRKQNRQ